MYSCDRVCSCTVVDARFAWIALPPPFARMPACRPIPIIPFRVNRTSASRAAVQSVVVLPRANMRVVAMYFSFT